MSTRSRTGNTRCGRRVTGSAHISRASTTTASSFKLVRVVVDLASFEERHEAHHHARATPGRARSRRGQRAGQDHPSDSLQHPARGDQGRDSPLGHRSRHRGEHHGGGLGGSGGSDHPAGPEAGGDRARAAQCRHPAHRFGRAAGHHRVRALQVPSARTAAGGVSRLPRGQVRGRLAGAGQGPAEADRPRGLRGEHRGEPPHPQRRALGAQAGADAHGGHQRAPARADGRAHAGLGRRRPRPT